jgi:hypothetical protein
VKRDQALIPLSHDHHGLVEARRLRRAATGDPPSGTRAATAFLLDEVRMLGEDAALQCVSLLPRHRRDVKWVAARALIRRLLQLASVDEFHVYVVRNTVLPGGQSEWHMHPGLSMITVVSATATFYDSDDPTDDAVDSLTSTCSETRATSTP